MTRLEDLQPTLEVWLVPPDPLESETMTRPTLNFDRLLKLRLIVARFGEMDLAKWWNARGQLGGLGTAAVRRGFPRTHLARYTHRVAISNHRLVNVADGKVTFRWKDYARGSRQRTMAVGGEEFLRRFLLHVLPRGFVRIRFFGFLANRRRTQLLPLCQRLLETISHQRLPAPQTGETKLPVSWLCPHCGGAMVLIEKFTAQEIRWKLAKASHFVDSS